jgi:hypothetical protein
MREEKEKDRTYDNDGNIGDREGENTGYSHPSSLITSFSP